MKPSEFRNKLREEEKKEKGQWLIDCTNKTIEANKGYYTISENNNIIALIPTDNDGKIVKIIRSAPELLKFAEMILAICNNQLTINTGIDFKILQKQALEVIEKTK